METKDTTPTARFDIKKGECWLLWRGAAVVDVFIYSLTGDKIYIQVSEAPYINHDSKLEHLFVKKAYGDLPIYQFFQSCVDANYDTKVAVTELGESDKYVYITTSKKSMRASTAGFNSNVYLVAPSPKALCKNNKSSHPFFECYFGGELSELILSNYNN